MSHDEQNKNSTLTHYEEAGSGGEKQENSFFELARFALIALIIVVPIRWYVAQPFIVSGASMEDTFHHNEYLIVDRLTYRFEEPERGDVIIFRYPNDPSKYFIKRIIGLPGETVVIDGSRVIIENDDHPGGLILDEPYISSMEKTGSQSLALAAGEYFVMGDNRDHSSDSRIWGVLKRDEIIGRAWLRLFPPAKLSFLPGNHASDQ